MKHIHLITTIAGVMIMMILLPGCGTDSAHRVAMLENAMQHVNQASSRIDTQIEDVNDLVTATRKAMADPNLQIEAAAQFALTLKKGEAQRWCCEGALRKRASPKEDSAFPNGRWIIQSKSCGVYEVSKNT